MVMRIIGCLLVIGILFSYLPMIPMDDCPNGDHMGNKKMSCGYIFHCPLVFNLIMPNLLRLPLVGRLILTPSSFQVDELPHAVFHPPEDLSANFIPHGMKEEKQFNVGLWHKNC